MNRKEHYLVTGAGGFLGQVISSVLASDGFDVTGLGLSDQNINVDITRPFSFENSLHFDVVVHAAGKAHVVPKTPEDEKAFYDVNFEGTKNLCTALDGLAVKPASFIFISTVAVYGLDSGNMIPEEQPLKGETPYAKSKILAEEWLAKWSGRHDIKLGILRLPLIAGPNPPGNLGAMIKGIKSGRYLSIGKANSKKSIVWQSDLPAIFPVLATNGGTFHLTDGVHPDFKQLETVISISLGKGVPRTIPILLAKALAFAGDLLGSRFPLNSDKLKKITSSLTFNDARARKVLGWKPSSVIEKLSESL